RYAERVRDSLVGRRLAVLALELLDRRADLAGHLAHAARHDVSATELVEDRAADPLLGERQERLVARLVVAIRRLGEPEQAGRDEILARDPVRAPARQPQRDPAGDLDVLGDQAIAF